MVNSLKQEHTFKASIAVGARFIGLTGSRVIDPGLNSVLIKPKGDATSIERALLYCFQFGCDIVASFFSQIKNISFTASLFFLCSNAGFHQPQQVCQPIIVIHFPKKSLWNERLLILSERRNS